MGGKKNNLKPMWDTLVKQVDFEEPTPLLDQENLGVTQRECKPNPQIVQENRNMFESLISAGTLSNKWLFGREKSHADIIAWPCDMEGHAKKCVARYCELANKKIEQLYAGPTRCRDDH